MAIVRSGFGGWRDGECSRLGELLRKHPWKLRRKGKQPDLGGVARVDGIEDLLRQILKMVFKLNHREGNGVEAA